MAEKNKKKINMGNKGAFLNQFNRHMLWHFPTYEVVMEFLKKYDTHKVMTR
jgi:hypothetical protein